VALYYVYTKRESESLYDEAARLQVQAAAKLDAIHGLSNDDGTPLSNVERLAMRQTHFQLNETDRMIITYAFLSFFLFIRTNILTFLYGK
jgi:hypothetical protein